MPADSSKHGGIYRSPLSGAIICDFAADGRGGRTTVGRPRLDGETGPGTQREGLVLLDAHVTFERSNLQILIDPAFDSLKVLFEPFEDRFHNFICPLPIHVEVYAAF